METTQTLDSVYLFADIMLCLDDEDLEDIAASLPSADWLDYMEHRLIGLDVPASKPCLVRLPLAA